MVWPGFDARVFECMSSRPAVTECAAALSKKFTYSGDKPFPIGYPIALSPDSDARLSAVSAAYRRMLKAIMSAYKHDGRVQQMISMPDGIRELLRHDTDSCVSNDLHIFRLDLYTTADGGFKVLETNANCPGGLIYAGYAARSFRPVIGDSAALKPWPYEDDSWMARWYVEAARRAVGRAPARVVLLRERGGHRLELDEHADAFRRLGVLTLELDPRDLTACDGQLLAGDLPVEFAYHKISFVELETMRPHADRYVAGIGCGRIFVQNGWLARTVCDNKLCLALMSDPAFSYLFSAADLDLVRPHLAWARNVAFLDDDEIASVRRAKDDYVIKKPLDTRGRGVVVGLEATDEVWSQAVDRAQQDGWLVMHYVEPTHLPAGDGEQPRHDLAIAVIDGAIEGGYIRSSRDFKVNVARSGRLHPLFASAA